MIIEASVVNSRTVLLLWSPPPTQDHNGVIVKYIINITAQDTGKYRQVNVTGTSAVLVDLVASFTYFISVSAHTVETGPYSSYMTITLPQDGKKQIYYYQCIVKYWLLYHGIFEQFPQDSHAMYKQTLHLRPQFLSSGLLLLLKNRAETYFSTLSTSHTPEHWTLPSTPQTPQTSLSHLLNHMKLISASLQPRQL